MYTPDLRNRVKSYDKMRSTFEKANNLALKTKEIKQKLKNKSNWTATNYNDNINLEHNNNDSRLQSPNNKNNLKRTLSNSPNRRNVNPNTNNNAYNLIDSKSYK